MSNTARVFAQKMIAARKAKGWSQVDLAQRLDVSTQTIWTWEKGRKLCRPGRLEELAKVLDRSPDWFYQEDEGSSFEADEKPDPKGFRGRMIAEARSDFGVSIPQLAQRIGRPIALIRSWEDGSREPSFQEFDEAISAVESLGAKPRSRTLEVFGPTKEGPTDTETVEVPIAWFEKLVGFWDDMAKHIPSMEPFPSNIIELAKYRAAREKSSGGEDCLRILNEAITTPLSRLFIEQAEGRIARARERKPA